MKVLKLAILLGLFGVTSCHYEEHYLNEKLGESDLNVLMFTVPDCPLSITMAKPFLALRDSFHGVQLLAILSGEHYEQKELDEYSRRTGISTFVKDPDHRLAKHYGISVTPEFVLIDRLGNVLYQGLLDDRMESIGVYKQHWDQHYLVNAIKAEQAGQDIEPASTKAIGCEMEYE